MGTVLGTVIGTVMGTGHCNGHRAQKDVTESTHRWNLQENAHEIAHLAMGTVMGTGHCSGHWALERALGTGMGTGHCNGHCDGHCDGHWAQPEFTERTHRGTSQRELPEITHRENSQGAFIATRVAHYSVEQRCFEKRRATVFCLWNMELFGCNNVDMIRVIVTITLVGAIVGSFGGRFSGQL